MPELRAGARSDSCLRMGGRTPTIARHCPRSRSRDFTASPMPIAALTAASTRPACVPAGRPRRMSARASAPWARLSDEELLNLRFCDLGLSIDGSRLRLYLGRLYGELDSRGIRLHPHAWLSEEWFSP